jgi:hypothetical protein
MLFACIVLAANLQAEGHRIGAAVLLELLIWDNPISHLLRKLQVPVGYYAAAADSDTPVELYVANSKKAKYVGFHVSGGGRYALLADAEDAAAVSDVILDQTLLLVALLGDVDLGVIPDASTAGQAEVTAQHDTEQEKQQQQQQHEGGGDAGVVDRLFPFQQPDGIRGLNQQCFVGECQSRSAQPGLVDDSVMQQQQLSVSPPSS